MKIVFAFILSSLLLCGHCFAQSLISKLPSDGEWAKYKYSVTSIREDGRIRKSNGALTILSVGRELIDGEQHRWIELKLEYKTDRDDQTLWTEVTKFLIRESDVNNGKGLLANAKHTWSFDSSLNPGEVPAVTRHPRMLKRFQPKRENSKITGREKINTSTARYLCKRYVDSFNFTLRDSKTSLPDKHEYAVYGNEQTPFGTVKWTGTVTGGFGSKSTTTLTLDSIGKGAKPVIKKGR